MEQTYDCGGLKQRATGRREMPISAGLRAITASRKQRVAWARACLAWLSPADSTLSVLLNLVASAKGLVRLNAA